MGGLVDDNPSGSLDDYEILRPLGQGSHGVCHLVRDKHDGRRFVLKKVFLGNLSRSQRQAALDEARLLSKLKHPHIVEYRESFLSKDGPKSGAGRAAGAGEYLCLIMENCGGGDMLQRLQEQGRTLLPENEIMEWFVQMALAMQYLRRKRVLHRDLKTQNIFLTADNVVKLGDFGISRVLDGPASMATTVVGTPYYMSPELLENRPYNFKSDVWSLGCCLYEMAALRRPFEAKDMPQLVQKVLRSQPSSVSHTKYTHGLRELIRKLLTKQPIRRPTISEVLKTPYVARHVDRLNKMNNKLAKSIAAPEPAAKGAPLSVAGQAAGVRAGPKSKSAAKKGAEPKRPPPRTSSAPKTQASKPAKGGATSDAPPEPRASAEPSLPAAAQPASKKPSADPNDMRRSLEEQLWEEQDREKELRARVEAHKLQRRPGSPADAVRASRARSKWGQPAAGSGAAESQESAFAFARNISESVELKNAKWAEVSTNKNNQPPEEDSDDSDAETARQLAEQEQKITALKGNLARLRVEAYQKQLATDSPMGSFAKARPSWKAPNQGKDAEKAPELSFPESNDDETGDDDDGGVLLSIVPEDNDDEWATCSEASSDEEDSDDEELDADDECGDLPGSLCRRVSRLRSECTSMLGPEKFHSAYEILVDRPDITTDSTESYLNDADLCALFGGIATAQMSVGCRMVAELQFCERFLEGH